MTSILKLLKLLEWNKAAASSQCCEEKMIKVCRGDKLTQMAWGIR